MVYLEHILRKSVGDLQVDNDGNGKISTTSQCFDSTKLSTTFRVDNQSIIIPFTLRGPAHASEPHLLSFSYKSHSPLLLRVWEIMTELR